MQKIFLHIGVPKTGSSALQVWLAKNVNALKANDVLYPDAYALRNYQISSGNGQQLMDALANKKEKDYLQTLLSAWNGDFLFSSELFAAGIPQESLIRFKEIAHELGLEIHIIAFIRDVYNHYYSDFQQFFKRASKSPLTDDTSFYNFCEKRCKNSTLAWGERIRLFTSLFPNHHILHYDKEKPTGLDRPFYGILGLEESRIPRMSNRVVNRSLNPIELRMVQLFRTEFAHYFPNTDISTFITAVSDYILSAKPEQHTELLYDINTCQLLEDRLAKDLAQFNEEFSLNVQIINLDEKKKLTGIPQLPEYMEIYIKALFAGFRRTTRDA